LYSKTSLDFALSNELENMTKIHVQYQVMMPQMLTAAVWNFSSIFCFS